MRKTVFRRLAQHSLFIYSILLPILALLNGSAAAKPRTAFVHLFEWRWDDIAQECERFLGPQGYDAVQISPPTEYLPKERRPWFDRYVPVSYRIAGRSGDEAAFRSMVRRCRAAGVSIYVDAVINHMGRHLFEGESYRGYAGTVFSHYEFPGLYRPWDFHDCKREIRDYSNRWEIQNCELGRLWDLKTESQWVRERIAAYLNHMLDLGVAGFRIDAAKHIAAEDLRAILSKLKKPAFVFSEIYDMGNEPIKSAEYQGFGHVTEFRYPREINQVFRGGKLAWLKNFGEAWKFQPSSKSVAFVDNHDIQREWNPKSASLSYKDGQIFKLATIFMLAWPYGYPSVMSSFAFTEADQSPPMRSDGSLIPVYRNGHPQCEPHWVCEHRWPEIAAMVGFRKATLEAQDVTNWWDNGNQQIAFGRGRTGFIVINREETVLEQTLQTSLPPGKYCNALAGPFEIKSKECEAREQVTVDGSGQAHFMVPPLSAFAIYR